MKKIQNAFNRHPFQLFLAIGTAVLTALLGLNLADTQVWYLPGAAEITGQLGTRVLFHVVFAQCRLGQRYSADWVHPLRGEACSRGDKPYPGSRRNVADRRRSSSPLWTFQ